jgi:D-serine deaminase-like pyridoxal phosphate-dependent protein
VERIVAAGTPGFLTDLEVLLSLGLDAEVQVSPGTWIYWDSICEEKLPGLFTFAALLLAKVMDVPGDDLLTLDLGYKRWAFDHGPVSVFSAPGLEFVSASEEHTVLRARDGGRRPGYGEPLLFAPRHVCPTVNLWESFTLVGPHGEVEAESLPVSARNR